MQSRDTAVGVSTCRLCKIDRCRDLVQDAVMASGFCNTCSQLLKEFADHLRSAWRELEIKIKEAFREIGRCNCFRISSERRTAFDLPSLRLNCGRKIAAMRIFYGNRSRRTKTEADGLCVIWKIEKHQSKRLDSNFFKLSYCMCYYSSKLYTSLYDQFN